MLHEKWISKGNAQTKNCHINKTQKFALAASKCLFIVILVMFSMCCFKSTFAGDPTEIKILHINSDLIDCVGAGPRTCMQIRESKYDEWKAFYDSIEGFTFEPGYLYQIIVEITDVKDPPADGSSKAYKLLAIVSKKKV